MAQYAEWVVSHFASELIAIFGQKIQTETLPNYDKAVLSLSTAFLGFSLAFVKNIVPISQAKWLYLLYVSWVTLVGSVVCTLISFVVSQYAINVQLSKAEDYYLRGDESALKKTASAITTDWVNFASGMLFILGLGLTTAFVSLNLERSLIMPDEQKGQQVPVREKEGAPIPKMQEVPLDKGAPIPRLQQVPQSQSENKPAAQIPPTTPPSNTAPSGESM